MDIDDLDAAAKHRNKKPELIGRTKEEREPPWSWQPVGNIRELTTRGCN
jgi:hypothetical protein